MTSTVVSVSAGELPRFHPVDELAGGQRPAANPLAVSVGSGRSARLSHRTPCPLPNLVSSTPQAPVHSLLRIRSELIIHVILSSSLGRTSSATAVCFSFLKLSSRQNKVDYVWWWVYYLLSTCLGGNVSVSKEALMAGG